MTASRHVLKAVVSLAALGSMACNAGSAWAAEGLVLVENGVARSVIVAVEGLRPSEKTAIAELQNYLKEMSGAAIEVKTPAEARVLNQSKLVVGNKTVRELYPDVTLDDLGEEGFVLKTTGNAFLIAGGERRGTLYGAYTLLETLGVRWWTPTESTIPDLKTIRVPEMNLREIPRLAYRDMMFNECFGDAGKLWMARNKLNGMSWESGPDQEKLGGRYEWIGAHFLHGATELLKSSGVPLTDDMWALVDGKRLPNSHPCLTNPNGVKAIAVSVIRELKAHPQARFVAVGHEERRFGGYCRCPECTAVATRETPSGLWLLFINQIAEAVAREVPNGRIAASAYNWTCNAPPNVKPRDNVIIAYDPLSADYAHALSEKNDEHVNIENDYTPGAHNRYRPGENKRVRREVEGWSKICNNLILYDYTVSLEHPYMPYPDLDVLASNIKYYAGHNFKGIFILGSLSNRGSEFNGLRMWVLAKALWNPDADGKALLSEFLAGYYRVAAPSIQRYIDVMHKVPRENKDFYLPFHGGYLNSLHLRPEIIALAEKELQEADRLAIGDAELERRVRHAHMPVWYILAKRGPDSATWKLAEEKAGKIDIVELANHYRQVNREQCAGKLPMADWLGDYAALQGKAIPPELKDVDSKQYRLIQACQMDGVAKFWKKTEGASDGWCEVLKSSPVGVWGLWLGLTPGEDYLPGKRYKVFVRVKTEGKFKKGKIMKCRVSNSQLGKPVDPSTGIEAKFITMGLTVDAAREIKETSRDVLSEELEDGQFHAIEIGEVVNPSCFSVDFLSPGSTGTMYLDCFWLLEAETAVP